MSKPARTFCTVAVLTVIVAAGADSPSTRMVSVERQLRLKRELLMGEQSLVATLEANRLRWQQLDPTRQEQLRRQAYAFRGADAARQRQIIAAWEKFWRLSEAQQQDYRRRAAWLKKVVEKLDDHQKQRLLEMKPTDRARELLKLKQQMDAEG